ncbi:MAG: RNA methyltransferase [Prolixibacteraceae bacterium]|nr:RNA methyltransferase [Prolixibacteraceae bacterium]
MVYKGLIEYISQFITEERYSLYKKIIEHRTRYITVVLEDIYQSQNASAVIRTCDCFGIQDVHVIENKNKFKINYNVSLGSTKWVDINLHNSEDENTLDAINSLKNRGYRIVAASPHFNDTSLDDFDLAKGKFAIVFGTERRGISDIVQQNADEFLKIPMYGFTESFNISVSAAIILHDLTEKLRSSGINWKLDKSEKDEILLEWIRKRIKGGDLIIKKYIESLKV